MSTTLKETDVSGGTGSRSSVLLTVSLLDSLGYVSLPLRDGDRTTYVKDFSRPGYSTDCSVWDSSNFGVSLYQREVDCLVDIDIDDSRLQAASVAILPHTDWIFGRKSKKVGHHVFVIDDSGGCGSFFDPLRKGPLGSEKVRRAGISGHDSYIDISSSLSSPDQTGSSGGDTSVAVDTSGPDGPSGTSSPGGDASSSDRDVIVEYRGSGCLLMMPGSKHASSGEELEWLDGKRPVSGPSRVRSGDLRFAFRRLGFLSLMSDFGWHSGSRHDATLSLSGMMCRCGWDLATIESWFSCLLSLTGEGDRRDVMRCVRDTHARFQSGDRILGISGFISATGSRSLASVFCKLFMDARDQSFEEYNERYAVGNYFSSVRVFDFDLIDDVGGTADFETLSVNDFHLLKSNDQVWVRSPGGNGKSGAKSGKSGMYVPKSKLWMDHPKRRTYRMTGFWPGGPGVVDGSLNLWRGWSSSPRSVSDPKTSGMSRWWCHMSDYVCGGDLALRDWLVSWLADIVQNPGSKPGTALILRSGQRSGKNTFVEMLKRMIGIRYFREYNDDGHITSRFNSHLQYALLVLVNEASLSLNGKAKGILKTLITDANFHMDHKHGHAKMGTNYTRVILASNELHVLDLDRDDRRYTVMDVLNPRDYMSDEGVRSHFSDIYAEISGEGPGCLLGYLQDYKYDRDEIRTCYRSAAGLRQIQMSMVPIARWWMICLLRGTVFIPDEYRDQVVYADGCGPGSWPVAIGRAALFGSYSRDNRAFGDVSRQDFFSMFYRESGLGDCRVRHLGGRGRGVRYRSMDLPDLEECVRRFEVLNPGTIDSAVTEGALDSVDDVVVGDSEF